MSAYQHFVEACAEEGYGDWLVEFDNAISMRGTIGNIINSGQLKAYEEFAIWKNKINEIDEKLKQSFIKDKQREEGYMLVRKEEY